MNEVETTGSVPSGSAEHSKVSVAYSQSSESDDDDGEQRLYKTIKVAKSRAKTRAKGVIERGVARFLDEKQSRNKDVSLKNTIDDPAFHPRSAKQRQLEHAQRNSPTAKAKIAVEAAAATLVHPKRTIRAKAKRVAAGKISSIQKPHSLPTTGVELLQAYDAYSHSESSRSSEYTSDSQISENEAIRRKTKAKKRARLAQLQAQRESMRVAWITRHIDRVRVVPKEHLKYPHKQAFHEKDEKDKTLFRCGRWIGHLLLWYTQDFSVQYIDDFESLPFDIDTLRNHTERLVMASAPWQIWLMDIRSVYRWEDPKRTGRWLTCFVFLWYTEHVMAFIWFCILYYTVRNKLYPASMKHLRASIQRSVDRESAAFQFGEIIDRHGRDDWLDPLVEELGPYLQLQVGDMANLLEVLANFYSWKAPRKTVASLIFFTSCLLAALFADMRFCMKIFWFIIGGSFFLCWPVASLYPRYRYLVSPFKWVLWDIPTHAEWSFQYLRKHCQESRESMIAHQVEEKFKAEIDEPPLEKYEGRLDLPHPHIKLEGHGDNGLNSSDSEDWHSADSSASLLAGKRFLSYRAYSKGTPGRLVITPSGIRFIRSIRRQEMWFLAFTQIKEMQKFHGAARSSSKYQGIGIKSLLELQDINGHSYTLELHGDRDEAFNYIIGFSALQWQSLQPTRKDTTLKFAL
jgi:hypothetical protein